MNCSRMYIEGLNPPVNQNGRQRLPVATCHSTWPAVHADKGCHLSLQIPNLPPNVSTNHLSHPLTDKRFQEPHVNQDGPRPLTDKRLKEPPVTQHGGWPTYRQRSHLSTR